MERERGKKLADLSLSLGENGAGKMRTNEAAAVLPFGLTPYKTDVWIFARRSERKWNKQATIVKMFPMTVRVTFTGHLRRFFVQLWTCAGCFQLIRLFFFPSGVENFSRKVQFMQRREAKEARR